ncbi:MAG TPA: ACP S-malonyltransferase [Acidobacteriaceae bacterium]|nr:ACP S-malonyltransferase [Acidobacteriaceae bacterium]
MKFDRIDRTKLHQQVDQWNQQHPVNTEVSVQGYSETKRTRTPATILFAKKPVIYLADHNGYFDLDAVTPVSPEQPTGSNLVQSNLCFMFPGQGSQKKGMGEVLFETFPDHVRAADQVLGYSIKDICLLDPDGLLSLTQYTQPAMYTVNALSWLDAIRLDNPDNPRPAFLIGHSVGEYNALFAAGVFDFETGLRLVQKRGALMAEANGGGMAAVLGMSGDQVRKVLEERHLDRIDLANLNSDVQTVVAGPKDEIDRARAEFEVAGARMYIPLATSGAFHSRYMKDFQAPFEAFLAPFDFHPLSTPVISNVEALPYDQSRIKSLLVEQLVSQVRWSDSIRYLTDRGVDIFREIGPGNILTGMIAKRRQRVTV